MFFIVFFPVTVLLQGQFKVKTTTLFQPHFNVVSTLKPQRCLNVESTTSVQLSNTTIFQPYFNVDVWLLFQRWYNVVVPAGLLLGELCLCCAETDGSHHIHVVDTMKPRCYRGIASFKWIVHFTLLLTSSRSSKWEGSRIAVSHVAMFNTWLR